MTRWIVEFTTDRDSAKVVEAETRAGAKLAFDRWATGVGIKDYHIIDVWKMPTVQAPALDQATPVNT